MGVEVAGLVYALKDALSVAEGSTVLIFPVQGRFVRDFFQRSFQRLNAVIGIISLIGADTVDDMRHSFAGQGVIHISVFQRPKEAVFVRYVQALRPPLARCRTRFHLRRVHHAGQDGGELGERDVAVGVEFVVANAFDYAVGAGFVDRGGRPVGLGDVGEAGGVGKGEIGKGGGQGQKQEQDSNACFSDVVLSFHYFGSSLIFFDVRLEWRVFVVGILYGIWNLKSNKCHLFLMFCPLILIFLKH